MSCCRYCELFPWESGYEPNLPDRDCCPSCAEIEQLIRSIDVAQLVLAADRSDAREDRESARKFPPMLGRAIPWPERVWWWLDRVVRCFRKENADVD